MVKSNSFTNKPFQQLLHNTYKNDVLLYIWYFLLKNLYNKDFFLICNISYNPSSEFCYDKKGLSNDYDILSRQKGERMFIILFLFLFSSTSRNSLKKVPEYTSFSNTATIQDITCYICKCIFLKLFKSYLNIVLRMGGIHYLLLVQFRNREKYRISRTEWW